MEDRDQAIDELVERFANEFRRASDAGCPVPALEDFWDRCPDPELSNTYLARLVDVDFKGRFSLGRKPWVSDYVTPGFWPYRDSIIKGLNRALFEESSLLAGLGIDRFGVYRPRVLVGFGGNGASFLCGRESDGGETVAVKVAHPNDSAFDQLHREMQLLKASKIPGIPKYLADGEIEALSTAYLTLNYLEGVTLSRWLAGNPSRDDRFTVARLLSQRFADLEKAGIVHGDPSPENIIVSPPTANSLSEQVFLIDFGNARWRVRPSELQGFTPEYHAPELVLKGTEITSHATDLWSLGVLLHEILAGSHPFPYSSLGGGTTVKEWAVNAQNAPPRDRKDIPNELWRLLLISWRKDPERRGEIGPQAFHRQLLADIPAMVEAQSNPSSPLAEPRIDGRVTAQLAAGFVAAIRQMVEGIADEALRPKADRIREALQKSETLGNCQRELETAIKRTIDDLIENGKADAVSCAVRYLNDVPAGPAIPWMIAATALELVPDKVVRIPQYLREKLWIIERHDEEFVRFLSKLRHHLFAESFFGEAIGCANDLSARSALAGFAEKVADKFDDIGRIRKYIDDQCLQGSTGANHSRALERYLEHLREHQVATCSLPLVRGTQDHFEAKINDIFVPIPVRMRGGERAVKSSHANQIKASSADLASSRTGVGGSSASAEFDTSSDLARVLQGGRPIALLGQAGAGKSTLLKQTVMALADARSHELPDWKYAGSFVPVLLRVGDFAAFLSNNKGRFPQPCPGSIIAYLDNFYREGRRLALPLSFFDELLKRRGCAVFLDGLDETPFNERKLVANHIIEFIGYYGKRSEGEPLREARETSRENVFIMTSRPKAFELVENILTPASFEVCDIQPLEPPGIRQLVRNVLKVIEASQDTLQDKHCEAVCDSIFRNGEFQELAGNPLFCTALVLVYMYHGRELPSGLIDVLKAIIDLLLGYWREADKKATELGQTDDDGDGTVDLDTRIKIQRDRLGHIALQMQLTDKRPRIDLVSLLQLLSDYLMEKDQIHPEQATKYARRFLVSSHERSGLLLEMEKLDPPLYGFWHDMFREYLAAEAMTELRPEEFVETILKHIDNPAWEKVIEYAGSHRSLKGYLQKDLLLKCLESASQCKSTDNQEGWAWRMEMVGRIAYGMGEYLSANFRNEVRRALSQSLLEDETKLVHRIKIASRLDKLGWLTDSLHAFAVISLQNGKRLCVGKHLVTNQQYERFLSAADFSDPQHWSQPLGFTFDGRNYSLGQESLRWQKTNDGDKRFPKFWRDGNLGSANRGLPVVGINWFEANAYCHWLMHNWHKLEESRVNPWIDPQCIRLPMEREWSLAVFGASADNQFPWNASSDLKTAEAMAAFANIGKVLDRTNPVGMFTRGTSLPHGLVDPFGNAWQWQANLFDYSYRAMALRGGAYTTPFEFVSPDLRGCSELTSRDKDLGFRIAIELKEKV